MRSVASLGFKRGKKSRIVLLPEAGTGAIERMAAVIDVTFLQFPDQLAVAKGADEQATEKEVVTDWCLSRWAQG